MTNCTKKYILVISFIAILFCLINFLYYKMQNKCLNLEKESISLTLENAIKESNEEKIKYKKETDEIWQIEIPKIELKAPISEGTTQEVMQNYVGHFGNTPLLEGNIGLAAHNRGYPINYFYKIKDLEIGDYIIYKYKDKKRIYKVISSAVIKDTDWSYLQSSNKNIITLITCIANKPNNRLCIQALEVEEEKYE